jgi:hypothetical protein
MADRLFPFHMDRHFQHFTWTGTFNMDRHFQPLWFADDAGSTSRDGDF